MSPDIFKETPMNQYVQHISGQGKKWKVRGDPFTTYWDCDPFDPADVGLIIRLPKADYRLCDPPEDWRRVHVEFTPEYRGILLDSSVAVDLPRGYRFSSAVHIEKEGDRR